MANIAFQYRSIKDIAPLEVRLTYTLPTGKQRNIYAKTELEIPKAFWDDYRKGIRFKDAEKVNLKTDVDNLFKELREHVLLLFEGADTNLKSDWLRRAVKEFYHPEPVEAIPDKIVDYFDYYLDLRKAEIIPGGGSWKKWNEIRNKVKKFQKDTGRTYQIKDINETFKRDWAKWCNKRQYAPATIGKNLSYIKQVGLHAQTKGVEVSRDLLKLSLKIKKEAFPKIYLSRPELEKIEALTNLSETLDTSRDWLLISCYTGQRVSDFMRFDSTMIRTIKGKKFVDIKQQKTGKDVAIPLLPDTLKILSKRGGNFPAKQLDQKYNGYIKEVCRLAGITDQIKGKLISLVEVHGKTVKRAVPGTYEKYKLIGSHCGRRSFATNYYGILPTSFLMNITGHSTEAMLLRYIGKTSKDTAMEAYDIMLNAKR